MDSLPTPHLLVLNATTSEHHIPDDDPMQLTAEAIHLFLESIHQQKATVRMRLCELIFSRQWYIQSLILRSFDGIFTNARH